MQIVIDTRQCPCRTLNDECDISGHECYEDDICSSCPLIMNGGIKLPKNHGDLKDMGNLKYVFDLTKDNPIYSGKDIERAIKSMTTIIPADKESATDGIS